MLTREQRDKWANALESGEFPQCQGVLHNEVGYCCIGVFSIVVLGYSSIDISVYSSMPHKQTQTYGIIQEMLNIENEPSSKNAIHKFIRMNDGKNMSFKEIAVEVRSLPTSD